MFFPSYVNKRSVIYEIVLMLCQAETAELGNFFLVWVVLREEWNSWPSYQVYSLSALDSFAPNFLKFVRSTTSFSVSHSFCSQTRSGRITKPFNRELPDKRFSDMFLVNWLEWWQPYTNFYSCQLLWKNKMLSVDWTMIQIDFSYKQLAEIAKFQSKSDYAYRNAKKSKMVKHFFYGSLFYKSHMVTNCYDK